MHKLQDVHAPAIFCRKRPLPSFLPQMATDRLAEGLGSPGGGTRLKISLVQQLGQLSGGRETCPRRCRTALLLRVRLDPCLRAGSAPDVLPPIAPLGAREFGPMLAYEPDTTYIPDS
jgi:hypothetical protein